MGNRRPRVSRRLETVAESCAVTDGPSKETSRSARASRTRRARGGGAIMARFPRDSTGTRAVGRSHGTHLRETSRALLLAHLERQPIAAPNAPRARQARTGRHPAGHPRCGVPLTEIPNTARPSSLFFQRRSCDRLGPFASFRVQHRPRPLSTAQARPFLRAVTRLAIETGGSVTQNAKPCHLPDPRITLGQLRVS